MFLMVCVCLFAHLIKKSSVKEKVVKYIQNTRAGDVGKTLQAKNLMKKTI